MEGAADRLAAVDTRLRAIALFKLAILAFSTVAWRDELAPRTCGARVVRGRSAYAVGVGLNGFLPAGRGERAAKIARA